MWYVGSVSPHLCFSAANFQSSIHISVFSQQPGHYLRRCGFLLSLSSHKAPDLSGYSCHMFPHNKSGLKYIRIIFTCSTIRIHSVPSVSSSSSWFVITPNTNILQFNKPHNRKQERRDPGCTGCDGWIVVWRSKWCVMCLENYFSLFLIVWVRGWRAGSVLSLQSVDSRPSDRQHTVMIVRWETPPPSPVLQQTYLFIWKVTFISS